MSLKNKEIVCMMIITLSVMTIIGTISYAYFSATAEVRQQEASLTSGTMQLKFADNDNGVNAEITFGQSVTKNFTIENTSTLDALARINWVDLINTYTLRSLTYTLSQSDTIDGTYTEILGKTNVPKTNVSAKKTLVDNLTTHRKNILL